MCLLRPFSAGIILILGLIGHAAPAHAEQSAFIDEIVVTATRSERSLLDIPASASVVSEERLADLPLLGPKEALSGLAGVQSETRNGGYDTRLIIRGAGLKARYGVREIMVLLDDVPITDPDGMTRLDFVDTQMIKQIDVVRGPNSTLYGANAAGGVINIITHDPFAEKKDITAGFGSNNTRLLSLLYGSSLGNNFVTVSGSHKQTDGWRAWNDFSSSQGHIKLGHLLADGSTASGTFNYTEADIQLPGTLSQSEYLDDPAQLTGGPFRHNGRYSKTFSTSLRLEKEWIDWRFRPLVYLQDWEHVHPVPGTINNGGATIAGANLQAAYRHALFNRSTELIFGVSAQTDEGDNIKHTYRDVALTATGAIDHTLSDASGDLAETSSDRIDKWGVYLQESLQLHPDWGLDIGVRFDHVRFDLHATIYREFVWGANRYVVLPSPATIDTEKSFEQISPRVGLNWKYSERLSFYGNIATGFQTPQSSELNDNPDLDPALTINYEIGIKSRHPKGHRLDMAIFYQTVDDEIVQTALEGNQTSYSNAGETRKVGLEMAGELALPGGFNLGGTYTWSDFTFEHFTEPVYQYNPALGATELILYDRSGNRLPYIPRHQYSLFFGCRHHSGFKARIDTSNWGSYWVDNANSEKYEGYDWISKLMIGWEHGPWDLTLDVSNLFDRRYAMEVTKSGGELRFRPGAPRTYFGKLAYSF